MSPLCLHLPIVSKAGAVEGIGGMVPEGGRRLHLFDEDELGFHPGQFAFDEPAGLLLQGLRRCLGPPTVHERFAP